MLILQCTAAAYRELFTLPLAAIEAHMRFMGRFSTELAQAGERLEVRGRGDARARSESARHIERAGRRVPPNREAKVFIAGYWLVDCAGLERDLAIAAQASGAPGRGSAPLNIPIEVCAIMGCNSAGRVT